ncbi:SDR family NAD(P)-dependent oxidoreductase [Streptomyces sp. NBC_01497]|uniref:SDR family NAD(P)-dependent oxidoreductase n=1 Tax=Streptomyces sp. NBC_01497 TaxID=2903885 RepID=UPI002E3343C3|nr:SDR family oxidoreductase [Streptomyces sp. NBC_01497]
MGSRLREKTALVTGGTGRIGRAVAAALAAEGARVVVSGRDRARGEAVAAAIRDAGGSADFVAADLDGRADASRALAREATRVLGGRVDILVNNAGVFPGPSTPETDEATFDAVYGVNVKAPFFLTAALAPAMAEAGGGAIVNIGSWVVRLGLPAGVAYAASKGALETLTRSWAAEFGPRGVRVNTVSPGVIREQDGAADGSGVLMNGTPAGRSGAPDAIAHAVVYLASEEAVFVHGAILDVDGGRVSAAVIAA